MIISSGIKSVFFLPLPSELIKWSYISLKNWKTRLYVEKDLTDFFGIQAPLVTFKGAH